MIFFFFFSVFSIWWLGQNGYSSIAHQASLGKTAVSVSRCTWRQDERAVVRKHHCTSWVLWRAAGPWARSEPAGGG